MMTISVGKNMKKFKKSLISLTAALTLVFISVVSANAAGSYFLSEGFYYGVQNNEASVHGYEGQDRYVVIREKFLNYYVTSVDEFAFFGNETVRRLSFYDATYLRSLGTRAFADCVSLLEVDITSSIQEMSESVFDSCTSLENVRFRKDASAVIPTQTFYGCTSLKNVKFENDLTEIGSFAFADCSSLSYLELPRTVTSIAGNAFLNDTNLTLGVYYGTYAMQYAIDNNIPYTLLDMIKLGDVNGDNYVNINDVTCIQRHLASLEVLDGIKLYASDTNRDGVVTITDATTLQMFLAEYEIPSPIGEIMTQ